MTVEELIKKLEKVDKNLEVFINWDEHGPALFYHIQLMKLEDPDDYPDEWNMPDKWVELR